MTLRGLRDRVAEWVEFYLGFSIKSKTNRRELREFRARVARLKALEDSRPRYAQMSTAELFESAESVARDVLALIDEALSHKELAEKLVYLHEERERWASALEALVAEPFQRKDDRIYYFPGYLSYNGPPSFLTHRKQFEAIYEHYERMGDILWRLKIGVRHDN